MDIKKALVTGGGGFVGKAIVKNLVAAGIETSVVGRNSYPEVQQMGVRCVVGTISDQRVVDQAIRGVDCVFHTAALAGIWGPWRDYYSTNVVGTENVVRSCKENNVKALVYTSTPSVVFNRDHINGGNENLPYATKPLCNYARSKILAEKVVLLANDTTLRTCALRPHLIWGPGDPHLLPRLMESGRKNALKIVGDGSNLVDISYIDNVAYAHVLAASNLSGAGTAAGQAYFISQGEPVVLWQWINNLFEKMDINQITSSVSFSTAYKIGGLQELVYSLIRSKKEPKMTRFLAEQLAKSHYFSIAKARQDIGYEPIVSSQQGLENTVKWLRECI